MTRTKRTAYAIALLVIAALALFGLWALQYAEAAVDDGYTEKIHEFNVAIDVQSGGEIHVTESILYDFGTEDRHGIFRNIPGGHYNGTDYIPTRITVESVTDENGNPYLYENNGYSDSADLKIGDPDVTITGQHWYVISYTATTTITGFNDYDELFWNVTGNEWDVPILEASATVTLPAASAGEDSAAVCFSGVYGSVESNCTATVESDRQFLFTAEQLPAYNGLTLVANFSTGMVDDPFRLTSIQDRQVYVLIDEDGSIFVRDWFKYEFGSGTLGDFSQHYYTTLSDQELTRADYTIHSVTDEDGVEYALTQLPQLYDPAVSISQRNIGEDQEWIVVEYTIEHAIDNFEDIDQLHFNPLGGSADVNTENVFVIVWLPEGAQPVTTNATCTMITPPTTETPCEAAHDSTGTFTFATGFLPAHNELLVTADFDKGIVQPSAKIRVATESPGTSVYVQETEQYTNFYETVRLDPGTYTIDATGYRHISQTHTVQAVAGEMSVLTVTLEKMPYWIFIEDYLPIIITIVLSGCLILVWRRFGKDPEGRGVVVSQFEPPKNMTPAELGVVYDGKAHMHDITATLIHLAIRGYIRIEQKTKEGKKPKAGDYVFHKEKDFREDKTLADYEMEILKGIFTRTTTKEKKLSDLKNKFYKYIPNIKKDLYKRVVKEGYFPMNPARTKALYISGGFVIAFVLPIITTIVVETVGSVTYHWINVTGVIALVLSFLMPRRTKKGVLALEHIKGLKLYLTVAEKDRIQFHQSPQAYREHFEELLPYAIALKVEEEWAAHFEDMFQDTDSPSWYDYTAAAHIFSVSDFGGALASMSSVAGSSMSSTPSGSGSSGGGFSGGGGGGGGGGSW